MSQKLPVVVILGATGSGKTKLSLELAKKFKGEIIGADSMQVYKGLDIITAKATKEEQELVPHHLIDILEPHEIFTVVSYRNRALRIIDDLINRNKLPIVVGGTNYYIESLLWKILIEEAGSSEAVSLPHLSSSTQDHILPSNVLHDKLKQLDPDMARRLHPNNKRKILRSLEVFYQHGRKHSEILQDQQKLQGGSLYGGGLRFSNALIFRLQCEKTVLDDRLNKRVDTMLQNGLVQELTNFHKKYNESRLDQSNTCDYSKGIFQSIGFKEFHEYLMLDETERTSARGQQIFNICVENLKIATRRYARKQNKWTTNRFLAIGNNREVPPMYGLDVTDLTQWESNVSNPAEEIVQCYISGVPCNRNRLPLVEVASNPNSMDETFYCGICERMFVGSFQWRQHTKSNRHKRMLQRNKTRMEGDTKPPDALLDKNL